MQYPWENSPRRDHKAIVQIKAFYIDRYPVTNAEFKKFLDASRYHPRDDHNFLKDWKKTATRTGGRTSPSPGYRSKTHEPTLHGPASGCPMNGSGSTPPRETTDECILGVTTGIPRQCRFPRKATDCADRTRPAGLFVGQLGLGSAQRFWRTRTEGERNRKRGSAGSHNVGRPPRAVSVWTDKEKLARGIAAQDRIEEVPVAALTCVEPLRIPMK